MRTYPRNSPQAAARIVALAALADGHVSRTELDALQGADIEHQLGLPVAGFHAVLHGLCEDLLATAAQVWGDACKVDPDTLALLMDEVRDPALRERVLRLCVAVVQADRYVADGESVVLRAAVAHWGLYPELRLPPAAVLPLPDAAGARPSVPV